MSLTYENLYKTNGTILLLGQTGTGKSYLAKEIHQNSSNKRGPFVEVNLATISDTLLESELFGHMKGSFTGAQNNRRGYCEMANNGTLFLDEISELSLSSQKKLLRLLEEKKFSPVGSCDNRRFLGRIITATNRDLREMVTKKLFREDLYYRLNVFTYTLKPLSDRKHELMPLFNNFWEIFQKDEINQKPLHICDKLYQFFMDYSWPGNIRQLKNCAEFMLACGGDILSMKDLPEWMSNHDIDCEDFNDSFWEKFPSDYYNALAIFEAGYLKKKLSEYGGKINFTAKKLGVSKVTLISKAKKYAIDTENMRFLSYA